MSLWRIWFYWDTDKMIRFGMHNFGMQDKRMPLGLFTFGNLSFGMRLFPKRVGAFT